MKVPRGSAAGPLAGCLLPGGRLAPVRLLDLFNDGSRSIGTDLFDTTWYMSHPDVGPGGLRRRRR